MVIVATAMAMAGFGLVLILTLKENRVPRWVLGCLYVLSAVLGSVAVWR
jgi:hypothetical protein